MYSALFLWLAMVFYFAAAYAYTLVVGSICRRFLLFLGRSDRSPLVLDMS